MLLTVTCMIILLRMFHGLLFKQLVLNIRVEGNDDLSEKRACEISP